MRPRATNFEGREACSRCAAQRGAERSASPKRRDRDARVRGFHRAPSFAEAQSGGFARHNGRGAGVGRRCDSSGPSAIQSSQQQEEIKQRLDDVGEPALALCDGSGGEERDAEATAAQARLKLARDARDSAFQVAQQEVDALATNRKNKSEQL